ncbi:MAG TPA: DUF2007 domain-containing protein [Terriglobia bacterium]|nr:DUF2007 domain-containing protein [Terriglobia bacterium]
MVKVYSASSELEARMAQELLRNAGIESVIQGEMAPGIYPSTLGSWARQDLLVLEADAATAARILSELAGEEIPAAEA